MKLAIIAFASCMICVIALTARSAIAAPSSDKISNAILSPSRVVALDSKANDKDDVKVPKDKKKKSKKGHGDDDDDDDDHGHHHDHDQ